MKNCIWAGIFVIVIISGADAVERVKTKLPVYQGIVVYEIDEQSGEKRKITSARKRESRFSHLHVLVPKNVYEKDYQIPTSVSKAIVELKKMLPKEYFQFLIKRFGFVESSNDIYQHRNLQYDFDDRILDLESFLHDIWRLDEVNHTLSKQVNCLGHFELDLTPLFMLLAMKEVSNRDGDMLVEMQEARILTSTLANHCLELP